MCSFPSPAIDHLVDYQKRSSENRISSYNGFIFDSPTMPRTSRPPMRTANSNEIDHRTKYSGFQNRNKNLNSPLVKENFVNEDMEINRAAHGRYQPSGTGGYNNYQSAERMNGGFMNSSNPSLGFPMNEDFGQSPPSSSIGQNGFDEFFDAAEDDLSECVSDDESAKSQVFGRSPSSRGGFRDVASRLHDEIVRRVAAEEALTSEKQKRIELLAFLNSIGASVPAAFIATEQNGVHEGERKESMGSVTGVEAVAGTSGLVEEGAEQKSKIEGEEVGTVSNEGEEAQEVIVARLVSTAIAKGVAAAAAKEELERVLAQKEKEMSRLRDKMQFWERMNEELSNQTQENVELQRMRRRRRQRMQKVILAGLGVVLGVACSAAMAYAFSALENGTSSGSGNVTASEGGEVEVPSQGVTIMASSPPDSIIVDQRE